jgi:type IV pilus assembly protein PilO
MRSKQMVELLWKSQRGLLLLLGTLLALNLLLFVVLEQWIVPQVAEQESRFLQRQTEVRQLMRKQGRTAITPEQLYVLTSQDTVKFQQAVPDYQDFTGLIEELLILSNRAGLDITRISYSSEELKKSPLLKLSLNFNVVGDYKQLKKFINSLEQSVRLITIKQISLQGANDDGVNLRLSLETFFRTGSRES